MMLSTSEVPDLFELKGVESRGYFRAPDGVRYDPFRQDSGGNRQVKFLEMFHVAF
jgi:hypothetical protein